MQRRAKQQVLQIAQGVASLLGLTLIPTWRLERRSQAEYVRRVLEEWDVSSVVDVGANEGQYYDFLRREVNFKGPVLSVEPIPQVAATLKQKELLDPKLRVVEAALDKVAGKKMLNIANGTQFSSLLTVSDKANPRFSSMAAIASRVEVDVLTLDGLITDHSQFLGERTYLKLDTQGFDLNVLLGLARETYRVVAMQSEASVQPIYDSMPNYVETIEAITRLGFAVSQIFPNNEGHFPELIEFDCHFVKLNDRRVTSALDRSPLA